MTSDSTKRDSTLAAELAELNRKRTAKHGQAKRNIDKRIAEIETELQDRQQRKVSKEGVSDV